MNELIIVAAVALATALTTLMAHRTRPHANATRVAGLGTSVALVACALYFTSAAWDTHSLFTNTVLMASTVAIAWVYAWVVLLSRSVWRYAGLALTALFWLAALCAEPFTSHGVLEEATILLGVTAATNFLGHLLRARVNAALSRGPKAKINADRQAPDTAYEALQVALKSLDPKAFEALLATIVVPAANIAPLMQRFAAQDALTLTIEEEAPIARAQTALALYPFVHYTGKLIAALKNQEAATLTGKLLTTRASLTVTLVMQSPSAKTTDVATLKRAAYDTGFDAFDVTLAGEVLTFTMGWRLT